jgi:pimeloyl-ACP methyl ester carboxylesterase
MSLEQRIRVAEARLFATVGAEVEEFFIEVPSLALRLRVLSHGDGAPVLALHGVSLTAAAWAPLFGSLSGLRLIAVDLPGHGLSDPVRHRRHQVRPHSRQLIDGILDALGAEQMPIVGHSLGAMLALWHAAAGSPRVPRVVAIGDPAVALPGVRVRMPLSLLTVRGLGPAVLRAPSPRSVYRGLLSLGLGSSDAAAVPAPLVDALRLSARRPGNVTTVASLMHAINRFRRPRPESVLTGAELASIGVPAAFIWGSDDPYLSPDAALPSIRQIPAGTLHEVPGGHAPWLADPDATAGLIRRHLQAGSDLARTAAEPRPQRA